MRAFGVRPRRDLGQNFLIDSNILGVIERAAELDPADVVLEIGGGLGVLSEYLAPRCAHVHVVELDRALVPALRGRARARSTTRRLHVADAMALDLRGARPRADEGRREPALRDRRRRDPAHDRGARRRDALGGDGPARGRRAVRRARRGAAPTACRRCSRSSPATCASHRAVSRTVFHPVPNVDSVLVVLERTRPGAAAGAARARPGRVRAPAQGARPLARRCRRAFGRGGARTAPRERARRARPSRRRARRAARARGVPRALRSALR